MNDPDCLMSKIAEDIQDAGLTPEPQRFQGLGCDNMSAIVIKLNYQPATDETQPESEIEL